MRKTSFFLFLIFLLSLPLVLPFFRSGYFPTHDGEWAVVRLGAMHRALMAGHFPVRWAGNLNFSYGYPLFLFTYPLPYYLGEIFNLLGFGLVGAIKILFVLSVVFSGWAMFFLGKELFGVFGGLVAAIFYVYAPFRLVDLYVRGSLGESLAFVFFPLLVWVLLKVVKNNGYWIPLGSIFLAGLFLVHNVSALLFAPFLFALAFILILREPRKNRMTLVQRLSLVFILGFGLAAFFLVPVLVEKRNIVLSQVPLADVKEHFVNLSQLMLPSWGYGSPGTEDAFSFQLGWVHLLAFLIGVVFWLKEKKKMRSFSSLLFGFSFVSLILLVVLMLPVSFLFWQKIPLFSEIDFPWRALGLATFFLSLSLGYLMTRQYSRYLAVGLAILVILVNLGYAKPSEYINYGDIYYLTNEATTTSNDELMPVWVQQKPTERAQEKVEIISGKGVVSEVFFNAKKVSFGVETETGAVVQINTIYFPGWQVKLDGKDTPLQYQNEKGVMRLTVEPGEHRVVASFGETPVRLLADIISLVSLGAIVVVGITKGVGRKTP